MDFCSSPTDHNCDRGLPVGSSDVSMASLDNPSPEEPAHTPTEPDWNALMASMKTLAANAGVHLRSVKFKFLAGK